MSTPTDSEIEEQCAVAFAAEGTRWPSMTYEQGVAAALAWVTGDTDARPMDDD